MARGVVGELQQRLRDPLPVEQRHAVGGQVGAPGAVGQRPGPRHDPVAEGGQVDRLELDEVGPPGLGQHQQLVDQPGHAVDLVEQQRPGLLDVGRVVGCHHLEVSTQDGQGGTELMPGVVEHASLRPESRLESVEHRVEGDLQVGEVVVAGHLQPLVEGARADVVGRVAQAAQRPQQATGQPGRHRHDDDQGEQADERVGDEQVVQLLLGPGPVAAHHESRRAVGLLHR